MTGPSSCKRNCLVGGAARSTWFPNAIEAR
ncbi:unnamed protein product [Soboliphyme baturini]|uniref:Uncharacterized protein n=1 Tax=Soboliphyme baturini TaxID=241478 RepID=A0A183IYD8_9BILA|nr:unnamed protein product [Soboliphyme baturini]